ncbi:Alpha/beta hydrolase family-domain-containing protein [Russula earlei]|uniref:Alpha/beta hydrolase family-domain-containing protein n=1 Tax=Russula earlei TaxID=71964 RepID=A0ACC0UQS8_9AGAM|nr:Alpha/beta hydrolase family-domain-containing protein [Russula earlei]
MSHSIPRPRQQRHSPLPTPKPTPLLPLLPPPEPLAYPALPCPSRDRRFTDAYSVTAHIIPAAFPRSSPFIPLPAFPDRDHESKDDRRVRVEQCTNELLSLQARHVPDHSGSQPRVLWNVLNRYETFESTLRHLFRASDQDKRYRIDEVWAFDAVQHGDSGLINAQQLGALFFWSDHARDILNFILNFLPEKTDSALPTHLPRVPARVSEAREKHGFSERQLVVIGHSFGGCAAVLAARSTPAPFSGLILVDPVIVPPSFPQDESKRQYMVGALPRRSVWPSRAEAYSLMSKSPFFGTWDPDVLRDYVDYALVEDSSGRVSLKCTSIQEASVFADENGRIEAWLALSQIENRIAMKWIVPSWEASVLRSDEFAQERVWRRPENATNALIRKAAHMVEADLAQGLHYSPLGSHEGYPRQSAGSG